MGQVDRSRVDRAPKASAIHLRIVKKASWVISKKKVFRRNDPRKTLHVGIPVGMPMPRIGSEFWEWGAMGLCAGPVGRYEGRSRRSTH